MQPSLGPQAVLILSRLLPLEGLAEVPLAQGDILTARVLASEAGQVTLLLRGVRVQARAELPLQAGDELRVKVQQLGEQRLVLQVLDREMAGAPSREVAGGARAGMPGAAQAAQPAPNPALLALALPLALGGQTGEAAIRVDSEAESAHPGGQGGGLQVTVAWEGASLGPVQARLVVSAKPGGDGPALSVRLAVATVEARDLVLAGLPELDQTLTALGWTNADLGCQVRHPAILRAEQQTLIAGPQRLDLRR
ncbi:MAG: hypothetical protein ACYC5Y_06335 [Symbiobacteriia bacterium]